MAAPTGLRLQCAAQLWAQHHPQAAASPPWPWPQQLSAPPSLSTHQPTAAPHCFLAARRRQVPRMCGIIGVFKHEGNANVEIYEGLLMLQHRGQDSAGMVTTSWERFNEYKVGGVLVGWCVCGDWPAALRVHSFCELGAGAEIAAR